MSREEWGPGDLTAQYYKDVLRVEAASDHLDEELFSRMLDTYAELCRREGALSRPVGAEEWDEDVPDFSDLFGEDDEEPVVDEVPTSGKDSGEDEGQSDWRDIAPPDEVTFADDAVPHGTQRIVNELIDHHNDPYRPHWAVYMGLLDRLPDVPGDYAEFNDLHSAADPWDSEVAYEALMDLTTLVDGCFAVHKNGPTFEDSDLYSITQVGEAIKEWWTGAKYDQLRE